MGSIRRSLKSLDFLLILLVCVISIFGIIVIGSATSASQFRAGEQSWQQILFAAGLFLMMATALIDYHFITKFYIAIYIINLVLLAVLLIMPAPDGYSTARTLRFGSYSILPSEFAKIFMILFLAKFIDKNSHSVNRVSTLFLYALLTLVPAFFIMEQPSLSASMVVLVISLAILFVGKLDYKIVITSVSIVLPVVSIFISDLRRETPIFISKFLADYQLRRIMPLITPPDDRDPDFFQTRQSINAIGSGQLSGKGLYNGMINVPESHNDFIFAVIGEEFGFIGSCVFLILIFVIILKCFLIAHRASDLLGSLIASAVGTMLAFQVFINVGVATGMLPNTGMAFPFVSYGGSSMWVSMIAIGLVLNVSMCKKKSIFEG